MAHSRLSILQSQHQKQTDKLADMRRKHRQAQAKLQAEKKRLKRAQWEAAGQWLEAHGYPVQLDALAERLVADATKATAPSEFSCSPGAVAGYPAERLCNGHAAQPTVEILETNKHA